MKKLLAVFDGMHYSESVLQFAAKLNKLEPVLLTGIFLPSVDYSDIMIYYLGGMAGPLYIPETNNTEIIEENIGRFSLFCQTNKIDYRVHRDLEGHVLQSLKKETRYADLLLLNSKLFYENLGIDDQKEYLNDAMHNAECPVLLCSDQSSFPESIIIAYDGSESSVFALKQFAYLFPEFSELNTLIVYASAKDHTFPDIAFIKELAARHFKNFTLLKLDIDPKKYFNTWITDKGKALLVTGSYGRSAFAELFKRSFSKEILAEHKMPLFIAHS